METPPIPVNDPPKAGLVPSYSTVGSGVGTMASIVVLACLKQFAHWTPDPITAGAICGLCAVAAGYLPQSGRR